MATRNFVVKNGLTVGTATIDAATGNLTVNNAALGTLASATTFAGSGANLTNLPGANVTGTVPLATTAGTVSTAAQPNITSVGTLSALSVTGNVAAGNVKTDNLLYANGTAWDLGGQPGGSNTFVQYNVGGEFGGDSGFTYNTVSGVLSVTGNVSAGNVSGTSGSFTTVAGALTTASQPNITSTGTLTSLAVTGNVTTGNVSGTTGSFTDVAGTLTTASQPNITSTGTLTSLAVTGNVTTGNVSGTDGSFTTVAGSLTTAAQPNITSTGTLTSLAVTGNVTTGNVSGTTGSFTDVAGTLTTASQPNITSVGTLSSLAVTGNVDTSANVVTDSIIGKTAGVTITAIGTNQPVTLVPTGTGTVSVSSKRISDLAIPTASTDAATKQYVDDLAQGLAIHAPCKVGSTATFASMSGGTVTYDNGTSGVGATLTTTSAITTIDSISLSTNDRILIKDEVDEAHNGIYVYTSSTVLTRADDFDTATEIAGGDFTFISQGTVNNDTGWVNTDPVTTVGTDPIYFVQFSGAGTYTAGAGLTLTGTEFSVTDTAITPGSYGNGTHTATYTVNSRGQLTSGANVAITANAEALTGTSIASGVTGSSLTSVGTLGSLDVTGNVGAGNVSGTAGSFTTVAGSLTTASQPNITSTGTLTSLAVTGNVTSGNVSGTAGSFTTVAGSLTTAAQPNITSTGTLTSLAVTGNVTTGNVSGTAGSFTTVAGSLTTAAQPNITSVGTLTGLTVSAGIVGSVTGTASTITTAAQPNITSVGTLTALSVTGTTATGTLQTDNLQYANGNPWDLQNPGGSNTNVQFNDAEDFGGSSNFTFDKTTSNLTVTGNITVATGTIGGDAGRLSNVVGANVTGAVGFATVANSVAGANVSGAVAFATTANAVAGANVSGQVANAVVSGTVYSAAQPNITSVGTLTSVTTTGEVNAVSFGTSRSNVTVSTNTVIDEFDPSTYRTAKYVVSASGDDGYQSVETLLVHDGSDAYITIYGSVCSNVSADIVELSSNINGVSGNVTVYATTSSSNTNLNIVAQRILT